MVNSLKIYDIDEVISEYPYLDQSIYLNISNDSSSILNNENNNNLSNNN